MKYYLDGRFLFIDMNQNYTHCIVEGADRVICCQRSLEEAQRICGVIRREKMSRVDEMQRLLDEGHQHSGRSLTMFGCDVRSLYPTAGLLFGALQRMRSNAESVRIRELRTEG